jgi:hypothetical protein
MARLAVESIEEQRIGLAKFLRKQTTTNHSLSNVNNMRTGNDYRAAT